MSLRKSWRRPAQKTWQHASLLLLAAAGVVYIWRSWLPHSRSQSWYDAIPHCRAGSRGRLADHQAGYPPDDQVSHDSVFAIELPPYQRTDREPDKTRPGNRTPMKAIIAREISTLP
jgi:hypothetical protein